MVGQFGAADLQCEDKYKWLDEEELVDFSELDLSKVTLTLPAQSRSN